MWIDVLDAGRIVTINSDAIAKFETANRADSMTLITLQNKEGLMINERRSDFAQRLRNGVWQLPEQLRQYAQPEEMPDLPRFK